METRQYRLGDVCTLRAGSAFKKKYQGLGDGDLPFIKVSDMNLPSNQFRIQKANNWVSQETAIEIGAKPFPAGTVVFAKIGEAIKQNRVRLLTIPTLIDNNMLGAMPNLNLVQPHYLMFALGTIGLDRWATGTAMPYLTQGTLNGVPIELPDMRTQRKIAAVLAAYDELIENNLRRIEILEEMAQAVYREWFVNFRFPGHEDVAMVDSPLGPIAEGWEAAPLGEVADYIGRGVSPKYDDQSSSVVINQRCIRDHRVSFEPSRTHRSKVKPEKYVMRGDVLVNSTGVGTLGRVAQLRRHVEDMTVDSHVTILRPPEWIPSEYWGRVLVAEESTFERLGAGATGQTELSRTAIGAVTIVVPNTELGQTYAGHVRPMDELAENLAQQLANLRATRDLLLPKLVSGEIDVSDLDIDTEWLAT